jgi:hypothetical protein
MACECRAECSLGAAVLFTAAADSAMRRRGVAFHFVDVFHSVPPSRNSLVQAPLPAIRPVAVSGCQGGGGGGEGRRLRSCVVSRRRCVLRGLGVGRPQPFRCAVARLLGGLVARAVAHVFAVSARFSAGYRAACALGSAAQRWVVQVTSALLDDSETSNWLLVLLDDRWRRHRRTKTNTQTNKHTRTSTHARTATASGERSAARHGRG